LVGSARGPAVDASVESAHEPAEPLPVGRGEPRFPRIVPGRPSRAPGNRAQRIEPEHKRLERKTERIPVTPRSGRLVRRAEIPPGIAPKSRHRPGGRASLPAGGGPEGSLEHPAGVDKD